MEGWFSYVVVMKGKVDGPFSGDERSDRRGVFL